MDLVPAIAVCGMSVHHLTLSLPSGAAIPGGLWDNQYVGQLSFFSRTELAAMRDRTRSRRYCPAREQFR
ncbi:hypothetical protein AB0M46_51275, partial [Dactylosporangium sp. NPDC051485]|uniref:hypothetical protein n=1 Tax=Dactylosporangium sp. NPDC051485 TaxID=3154846 RepID=UPI00343ED0EE